MLGISGRMQITPVLRNTSRANLIPLTASFWEAYAGKTLILYDTAIYQDLLAALRYNRLYHEYRTTSLRVFNAVDRVMAIDNSERLVRVYEPDNVLYLTTKTDVAQSLAVCLNRINTKRLRHLYGIQIS